MDRRRTQGLPERLAELDRWIVERGDPTGSLAKVREGLLFERLKWRTVGRRATHRTL
jgi:hypothetical protein